MILTVTLNPSLDRTLELDTLRLGEVNRTVARHVEPSGKGVNVSRALATNGMPTRAVLPLGGPDGAQLGALLTAEGVNFTEVPVADGVRVNVSVATSDGVVTKLNEPGCELGADAAASLEKEVEVQAKRAGWVVLSGSLPPDLPVDFYATLGHRVHAAGARLALDSSADALRAGLDARPEVLKPNREELAELTGQRLVTLADVVSAAGEVRRVTGGRVLVSLGADGVIVVDDSAATYAGASPAPRLRSPIGAGDSLLAGYLSVLDAATGSAADEKDLTAGALREGIAWATAAVRAVGSVGDPASTADRKAVRVDEMVDVERVLRS